MRAALISLFAACALCGCASTRVDWIAAGPQFSPRAPETVQVFHSRKEISKPWAVIGLIHGGKLLEGQRGRIRKQEALARAIAAGNGADAIIVEEALEPRDVAPFFDDGTREPPHYYLSGVGIKFMETLTEKDRDAIEKWNKKP